MYHGYHKTCFWEFLHSFNVIPQLGIFDMVYRETRRTFLNFVVK